MLFLYYVVGIAVVFGGAIFFHEFGHFLVAKLVGVKVHVFSLGFGPRLFGRKTRETDYRISLLPLGGYVKMEGEDPRDKSADSGRSFSSKPRWQRICICLAGPFANVALAIFVLAGVYAVRFEEPVYLNEAARVGYVTPGSPVALSGISKGDVIVAVREVEVRTWREAMLNVMLGAGRELQLKVRRGDATAVNAKLDLRDIDPGNPKHLDRIGFSPAEPVIIEEFDEHSPARDAGMKIGDKIISANDIEILAFPEFLTVVGKSEGRKVEFVVERAGGFERLSVTPFFDDSSNLWRIGILILPLRVATTKLAPKDAIIASIGKNKEIVSTTFGALFGMARGDVSSRVISGPIGISVYAGKTAELGAIPLLRFLSLVSISLAILNLLPIAPLDGGHIFVLGIESFMRRDSSDRFKQLFVYAGYGFVLFLFVLGLWNDILRLVD
ncbi:MAG: RIP metalloprotease RseP [Patescibacteria group bacterium]